MGVKCVVAGPSPARFVPRGDEPALRLFAGVHYFDALVEAVRRTDPAKLIFGSDGPELHPGVELHFVRAICLHPAGESMVFGPTTSRLLGPHAVPSCPSSQQRRSPTACPWPCRAGRREA